MAKDAKDTATFFSHGTCKQYEYVLGLYPAALKIKAEKKCKKPEELIKLDDWYQNELPKRIKQRGKDAHMVHEEIVQTMKWKQTRGKFYPQLSYLVKVNTPRAVMQETKKAFRKLPNLEQAITALSNLKGVGTTMASALLAAAAPESAPFMADECLMAIPEIEGIDYTTKEYMNFVQHIQTTVDRLNGEKGNEDGDENDDSKQKKWSPHSVELALWTHYVASDLQPELLSDMPGLSSSIEEQPVRQKVPNGTTEIPISNIAVEEPSDESNLDTEADKGVKSSNGSTSVDSLDECTTRSEDSLDKPLPLIQNHNEEVNDSDSQSSAKRSLSCEDSSAEEQTETSEPDIKKAKTTDN